ncbi:MAG: type II secretion system protein GspN [Myxococcota bacterium]
MSFSVSRRVKAFAYPHWFLFCFGASLYATFPIDVVKAPVTHALEVALGKGKQGRYGVDPVVQIGALSPSLLGGVTLERLSLQLGSTDPEPGATLFFDEVSVRVGWLGLLLNDPSVHFDVSLYEGRVGGSVGLTGPKGANDKFLGHTRGFLQGKVSGLSSLTVDVSGIDLGRAPPVLEKAGVPVTGMVQGELDLQMGDEPSKQATGLIDLGIKGLTIGPGELQIPVPGLTGGLTLPLIDMGDLEVKAPVREGKATFEKASLTGRDFNASLEMELAFAATLGAARPTADGSFQISEQFLEQNSKFKTLLDFAAPLKRARDDQGRYHFNLRGTLAKPKFSLSSSGGKSTARRKQK